MGAKKDPKSGKWTIQYRYTDWKGNRKKSTKRGFKTKREAEEWLHNFLVKHQADFNMPFEDFLEIYYDGIKPRVKENTLRTKKYIFDLKILPYFGKLKMNEIKVPHILNWQNDLLEQEYAPTYTYTIHSQLSSLFNYAVNFYGLESNPCKKAGSIGAKHAGEMKFWTKSEFEQFLDCVMNKQQSYMAFMTFFWTGMRLGEVLALTVGDVDIEKKSISITKSYQRIDRRDVITEPKTKKSKRVITIPQFLVVDFQDYIRSLYEPQGGDRLFPFTKHYLENEMKRGVQLSGVKRIRIHDIRHSHASMLVEMGFSPLEIANRLGHG